jgi:hypothetical protein
MSDLPLLSMWRHSRATSDILGYARLQHDWNGEKEAYHVLHPHVGSTMFGPAGHFVPVVGPFLSAGGALVGHAAGRTVSAAVEPTLIEAAPNGDSSPAAAVAAGEIAILKSRAELTSPEVADDDRILKAGFEERPRSRGRAGGTDD